MLVLGMTVSACNPIASDGAESGVCREQEREVLVAEKLHKDSPSTPFTVDAGDDVWVGLIADSDYSPSALFSQVTGLYVVDEGDVVAYTRDDLGFVVTDAVHRLRPRGPVRAVRILPRQLPGLEHQDAGDRRRGLPTREGLTT